MSEMLERIAKALYDRAPQLGDDPPFSGQTARCRALYLDDARAVLKAMRDPTEAMRSAGAAAEPFRSSLTEWKTGHIAAHTVWRDMIDAVLVGEP